MEISKFTAEERAKLEKGRKDSVIEIARNLLVNGVSPEIVSTSTGLSLDEMVGLSQGK